MTDDDTEAIGAAPNEDTDALPYIGPERRKEDRARIAWEAKMHRENKTRFEAIEAVQKKLVEDVASQNARMNRMEVSLAENTTATHEYGADVKTVLSIIEGGRKGVRFGIKVGKGMRWFGVQLARLLGWLTKIAIGIGVIWALMHGHLPKG